jgi:hypothetical protein
MRESALASADDRRAAGVRSALALAGGSRRIRRKPRSVEERAVIVAMAAGGLRRRIEAGRMTADGARAFTLLPAPRRLTITAQRTDRPPATTGADR